MSNAAPEIELEMDAAPLATRQPMDFARPWLARVKDCRTYAEVVTLHDEIKAARLDEPVLRLIRPVFGAKRDACKARWEAECRAASLASTAKELGSWQLLWRGLAQGVFERRDLVADLPRPLTPGLAATLDAVPEQVDDNATPRTDSMAGGQLRGVGFSSADGYAQAIRNGVPAHTHQGYIRTLRDTYHWTNTQLSALPGPMVEAALPVGAGIQHGPESSDAGIAAMRARAAEVRARVTQTAEATRAEVRGEIGADQIVVGAATDGSGIMVGWSGYGEMRRDTLRQCLSDAGFDPAWVLASKSAYAHAGFALTMLNGGGRVVRADRGGLRVGQAVQLRSGQRARFQARWTVGSVRHEGATVGDPYGRTIMTAVLTTDGHLELTGDSYLCTKVMADFERRVDQELYPAAEVTMWLRATLLSRFAAVRMGGVWYVPHKYAAQAERFVACVADTGWGRDWILPALPVATTEQLCSGMARGLIGEAAEVIADLESQREQAKRAKKSEIGAAAASTLMVRLKAIVERVKGYAALLGERHFVKVREELLAAISKVEPLTDDTSARFALIRDEMGY